MLDQTTQTFTIRGMDCAGCAKTLETGIQQLAGVQQAEVNFTTEKLRLSGAVTHQAVVERVKELGYEVVEEQPAASAPSAAPNFLQFMWQRTNTRLAMLGGLFILPGLFFTELAGVEHPLIDLFSVLALLTAGWPIARSAWQSLRINRNININVLMTLAAVGAVTIGAYTEAGMVMVLFAIGEALEGYTSERARQAIRSLLTVVPQQATRLAPAGCSSDCGCHTAAEQVVEVTQLQVGDHILVKPGERIPMDGRVTSGASAVNQAPITGESQPVEKQPGDTVFASSVNGEGALEIEVTHLVADNTISRIIQMVESAQESRAPAQRFIDQFAQYYTPAVVLLALMVAVLPPLLWQAPFLGENGWLYRGLVLLIIACPCALVISTPVSMISGLSRAAQQGVLFKGGLHLETLSKIKAIAFDKTGTLTLGQPSVVSVRSALCEGEQCAYCADVLALAHAVEQRSEHPLATAITQKAEQWAVASKYPAAQGVQALTGRGVMGQVNGREVLIGSHTYFDQAIPHTARECQEAHTQAQQGYTPVMVSADGQYVGVINVADVVRPSSREAIHQLRQLGLQAVVMLTGDNPQTAAKIAQQTGVTELKAELLPQHKVAAVQELQQKYGAVAMVGDGINDAPALAAANLGIAIGGATSTAQAMETADVTLMSHDLRQLPFALALSQATLKTVQFNIAFSLITKLLFFGLVLVGLGHMWLAVLADVGTSLLVTLNGLRLLQYPNKFESKK